jgi:hypothetical protein
MITAKPPDRRPPLTQNSSPRQQHGAWTEPAVLWRKPLPIFRDSCMKSTNNRGVSLLKSQRLKFYGSGCLSEGLLSGRNKHARTPDFPSLFSLLSPDLLSSQDSVRRASTGSSVNAAQKREIAEREGSRSRSNNAYVRDGKRLEPLVELLQRSFTTDGVAEKDGQKIDHVITAKTLPRTAYPLGSAWSGCCAFAGTRP